MERRTRSGLRGEHPLNLPCWKNGSRQGAQVVTLVHNETSAGIKNPAKEVGRLARKHDALFLMDGITSIGGDVVEADTWGADVAIVGSQKCTRAGLGENGIKLEEFTFKTLADRIVELNIPMFLNSTVLEITDKAVVIP